MNIAWLFESNNQGRSNTSSGSYESVVEGNSVIGYGESGFTDPEARDFSKDDEKVIKITKVNYLIQANVEKHNTDEYSLTNDTNVGVAQLIVRRGQPFNVEVTFNRAFDKTTDELKLVFDIGKKPLPSKGTRVDIVLSDRDEPKQWGAKIKSCKGNKAVLTIFTPPTCYIGKWRLSIDTKIKDAEKTYRFRSKQDVFILFNPWCKDDAVFMPDESDRDEYVMNDTGKIFMGSKRNIRGRPWNFAQFDDWVLECALKLLEKSGLGWSARGDPIKMVRKLTSICNSIDNTGVLQGNWSGDYAGGASPGKWTGSQAILRDYYLMNAPVKFGQCWVFSGVLTTVCRTLGIPARSITNFASAHDSDSSITIDTYYNADGEELDALNIDSVWNFHVWNEAWMARPDLPVGYGGWQVIDATPQETSEGVFCCGPASLVAVIRGEVNWPYDGGFVFAEVNADRVRWVKQADGTWDKILQKNSIGKSISTKKKGNQLGRRTMFQKDDPDREDVTKYYKHAEGSEAERASVLNAQKCNTTSTLGAGTAYKTGPEDVKFTLVELDEIPYGKPFTVKVKVLNKSKQTRTVKGRLAASAVTYTGVNCGVISSSSIDLVLNGNKSGELLLGVSWDDYRDECREQAMIRMSCSAIVKETNQVYLEDDDFTLRKPDLEITCADKMTVGHDTKVTFEFINPTDAPLTQCNLEVTGPGLQETITLKTGNVPANGKFSYSMTVTPLKVGRKGKSRELIAKFSSRQLDDIDGSKTIEVLPAQ